MAKKGARRASKAQQEAVEAAQQGEHERMEEAAENSSEAGEPERAAEEAVEASEGSEDAEQEGGDEGSDEGGEHGGDDEAAAEAEAEEEEDAGEGGSDDGNWKEEDDDEEKKELSAKRLREYNEMMERRGVVYLARVPPFMKINKVRNLMEHYGRVTHIYLVEEDPAIRRRRRKAGGNGSKRYVEGWIEFADKKIARRVAESLNNTIIGGKKGNFYHDDIWNLKYLKGFKWEHLTEKLAYERRIREQKLAAQSMQDRRNAQQFVELLDKNTAYQKIQERKRKRGEDAGAGDAPAKTEKPQPKRKFKQIKPITDQAITLG